MIIHSNFSQMKNKILPTCLQGNYRENLGEISNESPKDDHTPHYWPKINYYYYHYKYY